MRCAGCGGLVGRDCFNPQECEWISRDMVESQHQQSEPQQEHGGPTQSACQSCGFEFYGYGYMGEPCSEECQEKMRTA